MGLNSKTQKWVCKIQNSRYYLSYSNLEFLYLFQAPKLYSNANDPTACEHIGYMLDGGKLYGLCDKKSCFHLKDGIEAGQAQTENDYEFVESDACHLDECNMAEKDGEMAYFISEEWPYVPKCLKGQASQIYGLTVSEETPEATTAGADATTVGAVTTTAAAETTTAAAETTTAA